MKDKSLKDQINEAISEIPQQLVVLESGVDPDLLKEYFEKSAVVLALENPDATTIQILSEKLTSVDISDNEKKDILLQLSHSGTVECYRAIEQYEKLLDDTLLKKWAILALQECRMFLESELLDESHGFILSGLGGLGNKLRYFFAVVAAQKNSLTKRQLHSIQSEVASICQKSNGIIEKVKCNKDYVSFTALIPIDIAVGDIIEQSIAQCNELGNYLMDDFLITNMEIPSDDELITYIDKMRNPSPEDYSEDEDSLLF